MKIDKRLLRPEPAIRDELVEQLTDLFTRWEAWKCQS
jgi:hypothetical protein